MKHGESKTKSRSPVLAAVLHEMLKTTTFETETDVRDALKWRAAKLRIPYTGDTISQALDLVARSRRVCHVKPGRAA